MNGRAVAAVSASTGGSGRRHHKSTVNTPRSAIKEGKSELKSPSFWLNIFVLTANSLNLFFRNGTPTTINC